MAQLTLELPDTLHHQLEGLAQREGVQLTQYILYILTRQVGSVYTVQVMSEASVAEQEADYLALRQQWGKASPAQVEEVLAKRNVVEPEPELKPDVVEKLRQRIEAKQRED
ncbi:MAG: toxin-antitoxin system HicB family antitoxin [Anaerolineae bacterium]|nr:toxin-antitoxin system HicB family antitoxin [Anaerolineae bacterium]